MLIKNYSAITNSNKLQAKKNNKKGYKKTHCKNKLCPLNNGYRKMAFNFTMNQ